MIGRIYKLEGGGKFYIGSTTSSLNRRFIRHKSKSKETVCENTPVYVHFRNIGWENCVISLIEELVFENRRQLLERETQEINKYLSNELCLNHNRPLITREQKKQMDVEYGKKRRHHNKEEECKRLQEWRKLNPEKYKAQYDRYNKKKYA
jgi:hypothetical protein